MAFAEMSYGHVAYTTLNVFGSLQEKAREKTEACRRLFLSRQSCWMLPILAVLCLYLLERRAVYSGRKEL